MKKLLNTLYVLNPDHYLSLDGENVIVKKENSTVGRLPLHNLESIITFGYTGASPGLMNACAKRNISLVFMSPNGRFQARVVGETYGNVLLRKAQYRFSDNKKVSAEISKNFLIGKLYNSYSTLSRTIRDHGMKVDSEAIEKTKSFLLQSLDCVKKSSSLEELMGFEGKAATAYFDSFDHMIINQKDDFYFVCRSKRPPLDNVNAVLSFLYVLLANDCASALEGVGLDSYVGLLHQDRPGRASLALDLMEEFRAIFADRLALTLINRNQISGKGFIRNENGSVAMDSDTKKVVLNEWQNKKKSIITHPFLEEKIEWGMVPHIQAMLLARFIRGDIESYPPFLWK